MPPIALASCVSIQPSARAVTSRSASPSRPLIALDGRKAGCIMLRPLVSNPSNSPFQKMAGLQSLSGPSVNSLSSAIPTSLAFCLKCPARCRSAAANNSLRSPAFALGSTRNAKPSSLPMSSPSTNTRLSSAISTVSRPISPLDFRKSIEVRLSTNRWRNASCSASDSFCSKACARSAITCGSASQSARCDM